MFTWKPLYVEIANKVLTFENNQAGLLNLMSQMKSRGLAVMPLNDRDASGHAMEFWSAQFVAVELRSWDLHHVARRNS